MSASRKFLASVATAATIAAATGAAPAIARTLVNPPSSLVQAKVRIPDLLANAYGSAVAALGDLNGDGVVDFAVGERAANGNMGAVWILFMRADGSVASSAQISNATPFLAGSLHPDDEFGASVAALGDLDGDGVPDLAVGAPNDDDVSPAHTGGLGIDRGAVYILFLTSSGAPKSVLKLSDLTTGISLPGDFERFGASIASLGDPDGAGPLELALAAGAPGDADSDAPTGFARGAVYEVFLTWTGGSPPLVVDHTVKLSDTQGTPASFHLHDADLFGSSVARLTDLDGDGVSDLAVGAPLDDDNADGDLAPGANRGAVYVMLLNPNGSVKSYQKISATSGGFMAHLGRSNFFGDGVAALPDLDGNGVPDLAVGSGGYDDGGPGTGATWVVLLAYDHGTGAISIKQPLRISDNSGNLGGGLDAEGAFGASVASIGDLNGDGFPDLLAGAPGDGTGGVGSAWVLDLGRSAVALSSAPNPSNPGENVHFTASVTPGTGNVEFRDAGTPLGTSSLVSGSALFDTNLLADGSHPMTAYYEGDSVNIGGSSPVIVQLVGAVTAAQLALFAANPLEDGIEVKWQLGQPSLYSATVLERAQSLEGPWTAVTSPATTVDGVTSVLDADVVSGRSYEYRLSLTRSDGSTETIGHLSATAAQKVTVFALGAVTPNPATGPVEVSFSVARQARVRLSLLDVQGRVVSTLADDVRAPGVYQVTWSGDGARGAAPAGVYFLRYQTPGGTFTRRLVLAR